jgi:hypothetical protein
MPYSLRIAGKPDDAHFAQRASDFLKSKAVQNNGISLTTDNQNFTNEQRFRPRIS